MSCVSHDCCDAVSWLPLPLLGYVYMSTGTYLTRKAKTLENPAVALVRVGSVARASELACRRLRRMAGGVPSTLFVTRLAQLITIARRSPLEAYQDIVHLGLNGIVLCLST